MLSREHAKIRRVDGDPVTWTVEDCGSTNGVYVNNKRVGKKKGFGKVILNSGDVVRFGRDKPKSEFVFRFEITVTEQFAGLERPSSNPSGVKSRRLKLDVQL